MRSLTESFHEYQQLLMEEISSNPRFRRMLWVIVYILFGYLMVTLYDANQVLRTQAAQLASEHGRTSELENPDLWKQRQISENQVREQLFNSCWQAPSAGIASADMQTVLQQLLVGFELTNSRLTLSEPEQYEMHDGLVWLIRAQIRGRINRANVPLLVSALENRDSFFGIDRLYFLENRSGSLDMVVKACFREVQT